MKKVQILYDWEQLCSFSPVVKLLILHVGTRLDVKAQAALHEDVLLRPVRLSQCGDGLRRAEQAFSSVAFD